MSDFSMSYEPRTVAAGVTRTDCLWGHIWKGTAEALLAAGVVQGDWLADGSERDKRGRVVRSKQIARAGSTFKVRRTSSRQYQVEEHYGEGERLERERRLKFEKELRDQAKLLASMPASHRQFREQLAAYLARHLASPVQNIARRFGGYRYSPQALAEIVEARDELLRALLQGETLFSAKARAAEIVEIRAKTAAEDPGLQAFLKTIQAAPDET